MKIFIEKENKQLELEHERIRGIDLLNELEINPATIIIVKNNSVVLAEELLESNDEIKILSVISGG